MGCNHPFKGFWTGRYTEKGKRELIICPSTSGDLLNVIDAGRKGYTVAPSAPLFFENGQTYIKDPIPVPCSSCSGCRMQNAKNWKIRCVLEAQSWRNCYFITLTYDDVHLPFNEDGENVLKIEDLQGFWNRLKYYIKFRYFACGEYGEQFSRSHYHALLFTDAELELKPYGVNKFFSPLIDKCWSKGIIEVSYAETASIAYCVGYVEKKQLDPKWFKYSVKPFRVMSRRPGLGFEYLLKHDVLETGKVYGNFGSRSFASAPHYLIDKCQDDPRFKDFKLAMTENGKRYRNLTDAVFDVSDEDIKGLLMDDSINQLLKNKRKEKLR